MRVLALIFSFVLAGCGAEVSPEPIQDTAPNRVVSTSLCSDTYVLTLIADDDIAALSWQSGDALSTAPESFKNKPKANDDIETLLALNPTFVVFGPGEGRAAKPILDKMGISHYTLEWVNDFRAVQKNADLLIQKMQPKFVGTKDVLTPNYDRINGKLIQEQDRPTILYLSAAGGTAGSGTYVDTVITAAGGRNIISTPGWHTPDVEMIAVLKPDFIVTSFFKDSYASVSEAGLRNKVIQDKINSTPHVNVPGKLWPCAGFGLSEATRIVAFAINGQEYGLE